MTDGLDTRRLHETGQVYVTHAAARAYQERQRLDGVEAARRELTVLLLDARQTHGATADSAEAWRFRRRSAGVDLTARVVREGRLAVVTAVSVRGYKTRA